jgi:hypothetical protein
MTRIEDLVRDSLRQRAEDVEPTPALWREVDRRIARRRRFQVASWSLAAVAAALAAVMVLPGLFDGNGPGTVDIEYFGPRAQGVVPDVAVIVDGDGLALLELGTGERTALGVPVDGPVAHLAVRPGSTADDFDLAIVHTPDGAGATTTFVYGRVETGVSSTSEELGTLEVVPSIQWSPSGDHVAYTEPGENGRLRLLVAPAPDAPDFTEAGQDSDALDGFPSPAAATEVGTLGPDDVLLDWVLTEQEGLSELWVRQADGTVGILLLQADGSAFDAVTEGQLSVPDAWGGGTDETLVRDVAAAVSGTPGASTGGPPLYLLAPATRDGVSLYWSGPVAPTGSSPVTEVPLEDLVGNAGLEELWLDAEQDAVLLGDGRQVWLFAHDGQGDFAPPVELPDVAAAALFDAAR